MFRWFAGALLAVFLNLFAATSQASRAELDGRGLPRLLAIDPANLLLFPGSAAQFGRAALVDYSEYTYTPLDYIDYYSTRLLPPLVPSVTSSPERFAMGLTGKHLAFGYVLDGPTHNLVLSHESGWGASLGISDVYSLTQRIDQNPGGTIYYREVQEEVSRRDLRFTLGWAGTSGSGRVYEIALGGDLVSAQQSIFIQETSLDTVEIRGQDWSSEPGIGLDVRLRTLSPASGFQGVLRFAYEDLQPETISGDPATWIRRYALAELGWRLSFQAIDDLMAGVVLEWSHDTFLNVPGASFYTPEWENTENTRYFGQIFASGEHRVIGRWVGRAGVRGSAYFQEQETTEGGGDDDAYKRTRGGILNPEFFLGVGWTWKQFTLDGRIRENINLTNPVSQWSVGYSW